MYITYPPGPFRAAAPPKMAILEDFCKLKDIRNSIGTASKRKSRGDFTEQGSQNGMQRHKFHDTHLSR